MPRWLKWWLALFIGINLACVALNAPNPVTLLWQVATQPAPEARSVDGLTHGLSVVLGLGMLLGWIVLAVVMAVVMRDRRKRR